MSKEVRNYIMFIVSVVVIFMAGSHLLDVGDIAGDLSLTNGFFNVKASKIYHLGFYISYIAFMALVVSNIWIYTKYRLKGD